MAWTWRYESESGEVLSVDTPSAEEFPSRGDAESWLGEEWRALAEAGVERAALLEDGQTQYTMRLAEDG
ncbi:hypothetical protein [Nocardiopsis coralliicola]